MVVHIFKICFHLIYHQYIFINFILVSWQSLRSLTRDAYNHKLSLQNSTSFKGQHVNELIRSMQITVVLTVKISHLLNSF